MNHNIPYDTSTETIRDAVRFDVIAALVRRINDNLARAGTRAFGTMWACYGFALFGLAPLADPRHQDGYLYWSNVIQLVALPMLMVGARLGSAVSHRTVPSPRHDRSLSLDVRLSLTKVTAAPPRLMTVHALRPGVQVGRP